MIIIWDNGGSYSDHSIHFVDVGEGEEAGMRVVWVNLPSHGNGFVAGVVQVLAWYKGKRESWETWVREYAPHEATCEREYKYFNEPCTCWIGRTGLEKP